MEAASVSSEEEEDVEEDEDECECEGAETMHDDQELLDAIASVKQEMYVPFFY